MSKDVIAFLLDQMEQQIVIIDNGTLVEVADASDQLSRLISLMREAVQ